MIYRNSKRVDLERMSAEIITLKDRIATYQDTVHGLRHSLKASESTNKRQKIVYESAIAEKDAVIKELNIRLHIWLPLGSVMEPIQAYPQVQHP